MHFIKSFRHRSLIILLAILFSFGNVYALENEDIEKLEIVNFLSGSWDISIDSDSMNIPFSWGTAVVNTMGTVVIDFGREQFPTFHIGEVGNYQILDISINNIDKIIELSIKKQHFDKTHIIKIHFGNNDSIWFDEEVLLNPKVGISNQYSRLSGPNFEYDENILSRLNIEILKYHGILNNSRVRIRKEPNLDGEHIDYLNNNQKVEILDRTDETIKIGNMYSVWYKIKTLDGIVGWSYGHFIDLETDDSASK